MKNKSKYLDNNIDVDFYAHSGISLSDIYQKTGYDQYYFVKKYRPELLPIFKENAERARIQNISNKREKSYKISKITKIAKGAVYDYTCHPYPYYFVGGVLSHNCYNHQLILNNVLFKKYLNEDTTISYLKEHKKWYDAVVLLGGEPTIQKDIVGFCSKLKRETGLLIKLDTNGLRPDVVKELITKQLIDYIAVDIKTSTLYNTKYLETKSVILNSKIKHEFRLTCVPTIIDDNNIKEILNLFTDVAIIYLQNFLPNHTYSKKLEKITPYPSSVLEKWAKLGNNVVLR